MENSDWVGIADASSPGILKQSIAETPYLKNNSFPKNLIRSPTGVIFGALKLALLQTLGTTIRTHLISTEG